MGMFTKEQLRQFISENHIQTAGDVQNALKICSSRKSSRSIRMTYRA
ncbi:hypothetical protein PALA111701_30535 [Paenibacillus lactis]